MPKQKPAPQRHYPHVIRNVGDLIPYINNARTHSDQQIRQIAASIKEFGFTNPVLIDEANGIIAGHGRVQAANLLGITDVPCIILAGLSEHQKKAYGIADNKLALNAGWNNELLSTELNNLLSNGIDLDLIGFSDEELDDIFGKTTTPDENYTRKIQSPIYEPNNDKPPLSDLFDLTTTDKLIETINGTEGLSEDERAFLIHAAQRHTVFSFSKIADYYAHSSETMQKLMIDSALIIIDFNRAIENGFVKLTEQIRQQYEIDAGPEGEEQDEPDPDDGSEAGGRPYAS